MGTKRNQQQLSWTLETHQIILDITTRYRLDQTKILFYDVTVTNPNGDSFTLPDSFMSDLVNNGNPKNFN